MSNTSIVPASPVEHYRRRLDRAERDLTAALQREIRARNRIDTSGGIAHVSEATIGQLVRAHELAFLAQIDVDRWRQRLDEATR